ncbi:uncharacterized protein LOC141678662 [Apium graveolens]|uniref:uncharacterized protein LOC141678662 n=1 Tax=Apium graveolens TaxID=4045 RepID=UPI003D7B2918
MLNACDSMLMNIEIHHHGRFNSDARNPRYIGGYIDIIKNFDTDLLSFRDLDEFAEKYHYSAECLVHFITDGENMGNGMRLLYDDDTIRECVIVCKPFGKIELYVDHSFTDDMTIAKDKGKRGVNDDQVDEGDSDQSEEHDDSEDDDYHYKETETEDSESDSDGSFYIESDEELKENKRDSKLVREEMRKAMATAPFEESDFDSDELRSIASSSEDENCKIGYVGPPVEKN